MEWIKKYDIKGRHVWISTFDCLGVLKTVTIQYEDRTNEDGDGESGYFWRTWNEPYVPHDQQDDSWSYHIEKVARKFEESYVTKYPGWKRVYPYQDDWKHLYFLHEKSGIKAFEHSFHDSAARIKTRNKYSDCFANTIAKAESYMNSTQQDIQANLAPIDINRTTYTYYPFEGYDK